MTKALVVEANTYTAEVAEIMLGIVGVDAERCSNSVEAMSIIEARRDFFDLVLVGNGVSGDGAALVEKIQKKYPLIFMTGGNISEIISGSSVLKSMVSYDKIALLVKPFDCLELGDAINKVVPSYRMEGPVRAKLVEEKRAVAGCHI